MNTNISLHLKRTANAVLCAIEGFFALKNTIKIIKLFFSILLKVLGQKRELFLC